MSAICSFRGTPLFFLQISYHFCPIGVALRCCHKTTKEEASHDVRFVFMFGRFDKNEFVLLPNMN